MLSSARKDKMRKGKPRKINMPPQVGQWLRRAYAVDRDGLIPKTALYESYETFCNSIKIRPRPPNTFGKLLLLVYPHIRTRRMGPHSRQVAYYAGISPQIYNDEESDQDAEDVMEKEEEDACSDEENLSPNESMRSSPASSPLSSPPTSPPLTFTAPTQPLTYYASTLTQPPCFGVTPSTGITQCATPFIPCDAATFYTPSLDWTEEEAFSSYAEEEAFFLSSTPFKQEAGEEASSNTPNSKEMDLELQSWISALAEEGNTCDLLSFDSNIFQQQQQSYYQPQPSFPTTSLQQPPLDFQLLLLQQHRQQLLQQQQLQLQEYLRKKRLHEGEEWKEWLAVDHQEPQCRLQANADRFDRVDLPFISNIYN